MSEKLIKRVVLSSIIVAREDGSQPEVGKVFSFTEQEIEDIERLTPTAIRKGVAEVTSDDDDDDADGDDDDAAPVKSKGKKAKGAAAAAAAAALALDDDGL